MRSGWAGPLSEFYVPGPQLFYKGECSVDFKRKMKNLSRHHPWSKINVGSIIWRINVGTIILRNKKRKGKKK